MKKLIVTLNQVNRIIEENFKRRLFEEAVKIERKSDFQSVGKGGVNKPEDVKHVLDLFSHEKVGMSKEIQDVIKKCSSKDKTSSSTETTPASSDTKNTSNSDKSTSDLVDAIVSSDSKSTTSSDAANKSSSESSDIDYAAIGKCTDFHNLIGNYQKEKVFASGFSDSRIDSAQATIGVLYGEILGVSTNVDLSNIKTITSLSTNEKLAFDALKDKGYSPEGIAAVMGIVGGESGFQTFEEVDYSTTPNSSIRTIFGDRVNSLTDPQLDALKKNPAAFWDRVYGPDDPTGVSQKYGNTQKGDGLLYVGRGYNGITFKSNYQAMQTCSGIGFVNNPKLMSEPKYAAAALACYFNNFPTIKNAKNLDKAFQEAYRYNAGGAYTFEDYAKSPNIVHQNGIPLKRKKAQEYYNYILKAMNKEAPDSSTT